MNHSRERARRIGTRISKYRKDAGLTQAQLAAIAGIPQATLSQIESGTGAMEGPALIRIAHALGVRFESLVIDSLLEGEWAVAVCPGNHGSSMEAMREAALTYLANYRLAPRGKREQQQAGGE